MKSIKNRIRLLIILGIILLTGYLSNFIVAKFVLSGLNSKTYLLNSEPDRDGIRITMEMSKNWTEQIYYQGAEYDFILWNDSSHEISNWKVDLDLPVDTHTISDTEIWNVDYKQGIGSLHLSALNDTDLIPAGKSQPFGMILVGKELWTPESVKVSYVKNYKAMELPSFMVLLILSVAWGMLLVQIVSEQTVRRQAAVRAERDKQIILQSMSTFINFIDAKDPYTRGHSRRVATIASELARRLGLSEDEADQIYYAGLLHDSGKISVPDSILKKVGRLTPEEYAIMQQHPVSGGQMLLDFNAIDGIRDGALYHHERYDGTGYPERVKGTDIPLVGRIICVADSYDAMARDRCYRKHLDQDKILSEFRENSGTQFDPKIASIMLEMLLDGSAERLTVNL